MKAPKEQKNKTERVFLVGAEFRKGGKIEVRETMKELADLAITAGGQIIGEGTQRLERPHVATFIGKGKVAEIAEDCKQGNVDTVIFNDELSPSQIKNIQKIAGDKIKIVDRTGMIIDIFYQHARTKESKALFSRHILIPLKSL